MQTQIKVGMQAIIRNDSKILLGKRLSNYGEGMYSLPGGKLNYEESLDQGIKREILEETGLIIPKVEFISVFTALNKKSQDQYTNFVYFVDYTKLIPENQKVQNLEPDKCESWNWYDLESLPRPLFYYSSMSIFSWRRGWSHPRRLFEFDL